eukprot:5432854-Alexandrium_andersonii.AAC.1
MPVTCWTCQQPLSYWRRFGGCANLSCPNSSPHVIREAFKAKYVDEQPPEKLKPSTPTPPPPPHHPSPPERTAAVRPPKAIKTPQTVKPPPKPAREEPAKPKPAPPPTPPPSTVHQKKGAKGKGKQSAVKDQLDSKESGNA